MNEPSRRDERNENDNSRRASNDSADDRFTDDTRRRGTNQRPALTKREQEERWPVG